VLIGLISAWIGVRRGDHEPAYARWRLILLSAWLLLPPLLLFAVSQAKPLFIDRYLISVVPVAAILAAVGLVAIARRLRPLAIGAAAVVVCLSVLGRVHLEPVDDEDLRSAAEQIAREGRGSDGIAYAPAFTRVGLSWYLARQPGSDLPKDFAIAPDGKPGQVGDLYAREVTAEELVIRLRTYPRVWAVDYPDSDWHPTPEPMLDAGIEVLHEEYTRVSAEDFDGVLVELYQRR
jgi:mannosyltransferase